MKKILLLISLGMLLVGNAAFAEMKIAVVDLNKVLAADPQVKTMQAQLKKQFEGRNQELTSMQKNFQVDVDKYNKESSSLKGDSLKQAQSKLVAQEKKFQETRDKFQHDLMVAQNQSMQTVLKRVEGVVAKIAADQKFDLVLTKVSTVYSDPKFDITDQVVNSVKK